MSYVSDVPMISLFRDIFFLSLYDQSKKMPSLKDEQALNVTHRLTPSNGIFGTWLTGGTLMTSLKCVFFLMFTAICHLVSVEQK